MANMLETMVSRIGQVVVLLGSGEEVTDIRSAKSTAVVQDDTEARGLRAGW